ncbi:MAG: nickel-dependent lactate racemase [Oscillospiraceae bacterium]|nr:nickel-dependent lactate racemase [Oscillospiraceae bacterium]
MTHLQFPYGKGVMSAALPKQQIKAVLTSELESYRPDTDDVTLVRRALENPIGSLPLRELSRGKQKVTIIASDHTRPVPSKLLMPALLQEIRTGNPEAEITILIATGCHRETTREELVAKFGEDIVAREKIVIHDCDDTANMVLLGILPSGGECWVNRLACEADLLVSEGFIEPHFFAGYSGSRKAVLPGVAGRSTVLANHCAEFIDHPASRAGSLRDNPIHCDMVWAARKAGLAFILNVVLNGEKETIHAVAGDIEAAHEAGCAFLEGLCGVKAAMADIVITTNGGYPLDQNIYQAVKGMTAAEATVKEGGVIIMLAKSNDGHGGEAFCRELMAGDDMDALMADILSRGRGETLPDQWQAQIMIRILQRARVIYISDAEDVLVEQLHMTPAHSIEEALTLARRMLGREEVSITAIPDGVGVIVLP